MECRELGQENDCTGVQKKRLLSKHFRGRTPEQCVHHSSSPVSGMICAVSLGRNCTSSPRRRLISVLQLGRKMSPQLAAVERTMGIPGLPHLTAVLRVPQASHLQKPRRQKVRCKLMVLSGGSLGLCPLCLGQAGSGPLPSVRDLIPPFTWISGIMGKAVQILGLALYEWSSHSSEMSWDWEKRDGAALMMLFRLVFTAAICAGHSPLV